MVVEVIDVGNGFDLSFKFKGFGFGLYGMNEWVELVSGSVNIEMKIGEGINVILNILIWNIYWGNKIENSYCWWLCCCLYGVFYDFKLLKWYGSCCNGCRWCWSLLKSNGI